MTELVRTRRYETGNRLKPAVAVMLVHVLLAWLIVSGLRFDLPVRVAEELQLFEVIEPPPPPAEEKAPAEIPSEAEEGAAAPPALKADPTPVVAPEPVVPIERPHVPAASVAGQGTRPFAGAAPVPGPGTGAGGSGTGTGAGGSGTGVGAGGAATRPRLLRGRIRNRDYPRGALRSGAEGQVFARVQVAADGRVIGCRVEQSSGHPELDETTCRLIMQRFRYEPARDAQGNRVADVSGWVQRWWIGPD
ncbi:energy transducer TonB [Sphingosinicella sp. CPCC 101087]|uniref:energy transducer TonB n=1 Tax=Sphingosinicella sp. CPCC 101087 TaxID=2497754 RepID=UPI00101D37F3|nr:energy transducer TonB [Sphingosinicella sp. CPCC 101087]